MINDVIKEVIITWRTIKNDYNTTLIPITTYFVFSGFQRLDLSVFVISILYGIMYIVPFCMGNQLNGIEEDKLEKPYRPLPSGLINYNGAVWRYLIWTGMYILLSYKLGVMMWSGLWLLVSIFHNFLGGHKHFLTKNVICMTLGTASQFGAAWTTYHDNMTDSHTAWMWMTSIWIGVLANIQDFRDIEGDLRNHRKTLPIVFGTDARLIMSVTTIIVGVSLSLMLNSFKSHGLAVSINIGILAWHFLLAGRILLARSHKSDHITYKYHLSFMYCVIVLSSFIFLG